MANPLPETVLQFGTGKFLRLFADLFIHEANQGEMPLGRVVVVQSTGQSRAEAFNRANGRYHGAIRGLSQGAAVDRTVLVESVSRALVAETDWPGVLEVARSETLELIISNTTEAGYAVAGDEQRSTQPPRSFPAKLLAVLRERFESGRPGLTLLPCELLEENSRRLQALVLELASRWGMSEELRQWIRTECVWHDTLVDRIVSAPGQGDPLALSDPLYAVAEPFASWLIEGRLELAALAEHPAVETVENLAPYHLRKVRILNGAHTALVAKARPRGFVTVRQAISDRRLGAWLKTLLFDEIVPTLEGRVDDPAGFAQDALERFANPFLEHRLADIALHHEVKLRTRLLPTYEEFGRRFGRQPGLLGEILREVL